MAEHGDQPGFLTITNREHTVPFLTEPSGGSAGSGGATTGYLCNDDLGSYLHMPGSAAAEEARNGYVVRVQPTPGSSFEQQLKAALVALCSLQCKDTLPPSLTLDDAARCCTLQIDAFVVAPKGLQYE
jgi:hypothetical protein